MRMKWKICITSRETNLSGLRRRIHGLPQYYHEARVDYLKSIPDNFDVLTSGSSKIIITLRPRSQGGNFNRDAGTRSSILLRALRAEPDFLDIEFSAPAELKKKIFESRGKKTKIILSYHDIAGIPRNIMSIVKKMEREPADIIKIALATADAAQIDRLMDISAAIRKPKIIIGMGGGGMLTRIAPERFGSMLAFVSLSRRHSTAEGQLTVAELERFRENRGSRPRLLGIVGNRSALNSHGLSVYNHLFAQKGMNVIYAPVITRSLARTVKALRRLRFKGVSVTQPHKEEAYSLCDVVSLDARRIEAVNTLKFKKGRIYGYNTDYLAARRIFSQLPGAVGKNKRKAAIVGAGGVARAVAAALIDSGWDGVIFNRTLRRARRLASKYGLSAEPLKALQRIGNDFDILINCTSIGMDSNESIVKNRDILKAKIIMDIVSHPAETTLLRQAKMSGCQTVSGTYFWALQGAEQMNILISRNFKLKTIENILI